MKNNKWKIVLLGAVFMGGFVSLFASTSPDGLEKVAQVQGFLGVGKSFFAGIMPDYQISEIHSESLGKSLAGILGTVLIFASLFAIGKLLYKFEK